MASLACWWESTFEGITGTERQKNNDLKSKEPDLSKTSCEILGLNEPFPEKKEEEKLECPICFEGFDASGNAPHVLWCGHTLCKSCVLGLQRAVLKFQKLRPIVLPFFVSCPWCSVLSLRFAFKGNLKFPTKNYFVLWMVDSLEGARAKRDHQMVSCTTSNRQIKLLLLPSNLREEPSELNQGTPVPILTHFNAPLLLSSLCKSLLGFSPAKLVFHLALLLLFVALYATQVSTFLLALYALVALSLGYAFSFLPELCFPEIGSVG